MFLTVVIQILHTYLFFCRGANHLHQVSAIGKLTATFFHLGQLYQHEVNSTRSARPSIFDDLFFKNSGHCRRWPSWSFSSSLFCNTFLKCDTLWAETRSYLSLLELSNWDPRVPINRAALPNKSINLALSDRGILGIRGVSHVLAEEIVATTIPMRGRCLHDRNGGQVTQFYDVYGRVTLDFDET